MKQTSLPQQIRPEDTERALEIARRLAPFRRACREDAHAEAAADYTD